MTLTPGDVRNARFDKAKRGEFGYDEYEVDVLLDRVEATLSGQDTLTAEDVRAAKFTPRKHKKAYAPDAVNAFLHEVALTLTRRAEPKHGDRAVPAPRFAPKAPEKRKPQRTDAPASPPPRARARPTPSVSPPQLAPQDVSNVAFPGPEPGAPACDGDEVDAFLDRIEATLAGRDTLTAHDVLTARFNPPPPGQPGYNEAGVMAFLVMASASLKQLTERRDPAPEGNVIPLERHPEPLLQPAAETPELDSGPRGPFGQPTAPPPESDMYSPETPPMGLPVSRFDPGETLNVASVSAPTGAPTYDEDQVNAFLDRLEATLEGRDTVTAQDVLAARFSAPKPGRRGYSEVDFLSLVAKRLEKPDMRTRPESALGWHNDTALRPQLTSEEIRNVRLSRPAVGAPGYDAYQVDALLDRVEATLAGRDSLTMQDVRDATFHEVMPGYGGYDQKEVEALLGLVEERLSDDMVHRWHA